MGAYGADDQGGMSGAVYIFGQGDDDSDTDNWMNAMPSFSRKHHRQTLHDSPFFQRMTSSQLNAISNTKQKIETNIIPISSNAKISIEIINLPPIGNRLQDLEGQVRPYSSEKNAVQVAIFVNDQWRLKPGMNRMDGFSISDNGLFACDITTAPDDHLATKIAVLVVPVSAMPLDIRSIEHYPALGRMIIER
ncbi:MAG: hypothetical protein OMM_02504 [Candidatus Magnetoglobus multicellularis str. Araruama]|uniref:Uncharacterized protein n=1 Tax=Candidatus Magnetoglobus multicellularis str. Araruama TaxID=890399 RepID=A0A1V1P9C2_9BACT|nr:MAG: hypothetical protein OMM_02504 [Candidatus Magnetoglobus multicellularis str. Araruama]